MSYSLEWVVIRVLGTKKIIPSRGVFKNRTSSVSKGRLEIVVEYRLALSTRKCTAKTLSVPL